MTQSTDIVTQTARFTEVVRAFAPVSANRYAKLLPFKEGIAELRQKGASYRLIRELLATINVAVAVDTIGNFVREVIEQRPLVRPSRRRTAVRALSDPPASPTLPTPSRPQFPFTVAPPVEAPAVAAAPPTTPSNAAATPTLASPPERSRTRGPRIADPANL